MAAGYAPEKPEFPGSPVGPDGKAWPIDWYSKFDLSSRPDLAGPFNDMLYRISNGEIGSPYTAPVFDPTGGRGAEIAANIARMNAAGVGGGIGSGRGQSKSSLLQTVFPETQASAAVTPTVQRNARNPAIDAALGQSTGTYGPGGPMGKLRDQSLADFTKEYLATRGGAKSALDQESNFIDSVYNPSGVESKLSKLLAQRGAATRMAAESAIQRASRANNIARMFGGNSSYLDRAYAGDIGNALINAQLQNNDIARQNEMDLLSARSGLTGRRNSLLSAYLQAGLAPQEAIDAARMGDLSYLNSWANTDQNNAYYNLINGGLAPAAAPAPSVVRGRPVVRRGGLPTLPAGLSVRY